MLGSQTRGVQTVAETPENMMDYPDAPREPGPTTWPLPHRLVDRTVQHVSPGRSYVVHPWICNRSLATIAARRGAMARRGTPRRPLIGEARGMLHVAGRSVERFAVVAGVPSHPIGNREER